MHKAFRNLLRLILEAQCALDHTPPCRVTARAYINMADDAITELLAHMTYGFRYKHLRAAKDYSQNFCLNEPDWVQVIEFMDDFWNGVYDGFFRNSIKRVGYGHYEKGHGMMRGKI